MINNSYSRQSEVSPSFRWANASSILASADLIVSWESYNSASQKYLPFNFTRIINNGESDIIFYPNQDMNQGIDVPKGTMVALDRQTVPALSSFKIVNNGSITISASKIIVTNSREGVNTESIVQKLHKRILGQGVRGVI